MNSYILVSDDFIFSVSKSSKIFVCDHGTEFIQFPLLNPHLFSLLLVSIQTIHLQIVRHTN